MSEKILPSDMTVSEAADVLRVTDQTVRAWIAVGRIEAYKNASGRWRIPEEEVARARVGAAPSPDGVARHA